MVDIVKETRLLLSIVDLSFARIPIVWNVVANKLTWEGVFRSEVITISSYLCKFFMSCS